MSDTAIETVVNTIIMDVALNAARAALRVELPILNVPPISWVFDWITNRFAQAISKEVANNIALEVIALRTEAEKNAYEAAIEVLKNAKPENLNEAKQQFADSLRNLVHFHK